MDKPSSFSEFEIIRRFLATPELSFPRAGIELGIGDDAALIDVPSNKHLAMSMDVLIAGVHFPLDADPASIAHRALAVNLSDLAAMAAEPFCFTLGLVMPEVDESWLGGFSTGLSGLAREHNCPLVGGDTSRGPLSISIQVQGLAEKNGAARRCGAQLGDRVYVSGTLGDGAIALLALGLESHLGSTFALTENEIGATFRQFFADAYYRPQPRIELAARAGHLFSSCIDISDGLLGDLQHILDASELGSTIALDAIPYSEAAMRCVSDENRLLAALSGGDDYELCFTVAEKDCAELQAIATNIGVDLSCVGEITAGQGIAFVTADGTALEAGARAFQHFNAPA